MNQRKRVPGFDWVKPVPIKKVNQWAGPTKIFFTNGPGRCQFFMGRPDPPKKQKKNYKLYRRFVPKMRRPRYARWPVQPCRQRSSGRGSLGRRLSAQVRWCTGRRGGVQGQSLVGHQWRAGGVLTLYLPWRPGWISPTGRMRSIEVQCQRYPSQKV